MKTIRCPHQIEMSQEEARKIVLGGAGRRPDFPDGKTYVDEVRGHNMVQSEEKLMKKITEPICEACMPYICAYWDLPTEERLEKCKPLVKWADQIIFELSPLIEIMDRTREDCPHWRGVNNRVLCGTCLDCNGTGKVGGWNFDRILIKEE